MNAYLDKRAEEVILFNPKRSEDAEGMTVNGFHDWKRGGHVDPVVKDTFSKFDSHLCKTHLRVEILRKNGWKVPVLLPRGMQANIELLYKTRSFYSEYLFGRANNSCSHYRGSDRMWKLASKWGNKHADLITSTQLRKQLATLFQVLSLKETPKTYRQLSNDMLSEFREDALEWRKFQDFFIVSTTEQSQNLRD